MAQLFDLNSTFLTILVICIATLGAVVWAIKALGFFDMSRNTEEYRNAHRMFDSLDKHKTGYTMAVSIASHGFGESSLNISVQTANGFHDSKNVSTQRGASALFNIPGGEGDVKVCANYACTTVPEGTTQVTINGAG